MSLSTEQRQLIYDNHYSLGEAFDGKVPGIDPDELVANAIDETGCYTGPWTPFP
jgi:hypothetical protein